MAKSKLRSNGGSDQFARRIVQLGFLLLFLFPLLPLIYRRLSFQMTEDYASWLLPWDPLLAFGNLLNRNISAIIIGAPLFLLSLTLIFGHHRWSTSARLL